jgi:hypothetical protein
MFVGVALLLLTVAVLAAVSAAVMKRRGEQALHSWQAAARTLGLEFVGSRDPARKSERSICGSLNGTQVRVDLRQQIRSSGHTERSHQVMCFSAGEGARIPESLVVRRDSALRSLGRLVQGQEARVGDPAFDDLVELPGLDAHACAALSFEARQELQALVADGAEVRDGRLLWERLPSSADDRPWLLQTLRSWARVGGLLGVPPGSLQERLAQNALRDPSPGIRPNNLRLGGFSGALVQCAGSEHEMVRVAAAKALGQRAERGSEEALLRLLSDASSEVQCASAEALGAVGSVAAVEPLLPLANGMGRAQLRTAARSAIGRILWAMWKPVA